MFQSLFFWKCCLKSVKIVTRRRAKIVSILVFLEVVFKVLIQLPQTYLWRVSILVFLEVVFKEKMVIFRVPWNTSVSILVFLEVVFKGSSLPLKSKTTPEFQSLFFWKWCLKQEYAPGKLAGNLVSILIFLEVVFKVLTGNVGGRQCFVSILIFLEVVFKDHFDLVNPEEEICFNPYFSGSGV